MPKAAARRTLDRSRPFSEVYGLIGVAYTQDDLNFNPGGLEVNPLSFERIDDEPTPPSPRDDTPIFPAIVMSSNPTPEDREKGLDAKHWKHLKVMVEAYGGEWTTREAAIEFLRGKQL